MFEEVCGAAIRTFASLRTTTTVCTRVLSRRKDLLRGHFDDLAETLAADYLPTQLESAIGTLKRVFSALKISDLAR
jgi:hypothetical protein